MVEIQAKPKLNFDEKFFRITTATWLPISNEIDQSTENFLKFVTLAWQNKDVHNKLGENIDQIISKGVNYFLVLEIENILNFYTRATCCNRVQ